MKKSKPGHAICGGLLVAALFFAGAGCKTPGVVAYYGPTLPHAEVVADVNSNNRKIPTLRGSGSFKAVFRDAGKTTSVDGDLTLLYAEPNSVRLVAHNLAIGNIFDLASNHERYWAIIERQDVMYWGTRGAAMRSGAGIDLPIRPDLLLDVLGVTPLDSNLLQPPIPVMRFNNDADAYMIVWNEQSPTRWIAQKEVWYDRKTRMPICVLLFDVNGRIVLRAYLSDHKPIKLDGIPPDEWPRMATKFDILFPESGSKLSFDLNGSLELRGGKPPAPNEHTFVFPGGDSGVSHTIQLDE